MERRNEDGVGIDPPDGSVARIREEKPSICIEGDGKLNFLNLATGKHGNLLT